MPPPETTAAPTAPPVAPAPPGLPPRSPLVDDVYESLKAWILDQVRGPDVRLNIEALARSLQVSPTPVREALVRLEAEGFVAKAPQRGYSVTSPLTVAEVRDLYELRLLLEPWAAGEAARRATPADRDRLDAELATCTVAPDGAGYREYRSLVDHDGRFHDLLLEIAGNDHVRAAFARTHCHLHLFRLTYGSGMGTQALDEHQAITDAVRAGDVAGARDAMATHLERSRDRILVALDQRDPEVPPDGAQVQDPSR